MKHPSSTSSSDASVGGTRLPLAALLACALLVGAEFGARALVAGDFVVQGQTLRSYVEEKAAELAESQPACWMMGNSTMQRGVDVTAVTRALGSTAIDLPHGSASVRGLTAMAEFYIDRGAPPPRRLIVFATKDDLTTQGERALHSRRYTRLGSVLGRRLGDFSTLASSRDSIVRAAALAIRGTDPRSERVQPAGDGAPAGDAVASDESEVDAYLATRTRAVVRRFAVDIDVVERLEELAAEHGVERVDVILLPLLPAHLEVHDQMNPDLPWRTAVAEFAAECASRGIGFTDLTEAVTADEYFRDPIHLNARGREALSDRVVDAITR